MDTDTDAEAVALTPVKAKDFVSGSVLVNVTDVGSDTPLLVLKTRPRGSVSAGAVSSVTLNTCVPPMYTNDGSEMNMVPTRRIVRPSFENEPSALALLLSEKGTMLVPSSPSDDTYGDEKP